MCAVMAGGKAERLHGIVKPVVRICGTPMIIKVTDVACKLCKHVLIVLSEHTLRTAGLLKGICPDKLAAIAASGEYIEDLLYVLTVLPTPVLVIPSDVPFLDVKILSDFVQRATGVDADVVNLAIADRDEEKLTGISLFKLHGTKTNRWVNITYDRDDRLIDVDTIGDLRDVLAKCP